MWLAVEQPLQRASDLQRRHTQAVEERMDDPLLLAEKPQCEMLGKNRGMVLVLGKLSGGEQGFPALAGEFLRVHSHAFDRIENLSAMVSDLMEGCQPCLGPLGKDAQSPKPAPLRN